MQSTATLKTHANLVDRMADTVGIDLEQAMMEGRMTFDQLSDAVLACTGCSSPQTCQKWLSLQDTQADSTPDFCRNRETFQRLGDGKSA